MENNWAAHHMFAAAAASCSSFPSSSSQHLVDTALGGAHGPHITCLKLGKRQYYAGDAVAAGAIKRDRPSSSSSSSSSAATHVIPACQVEGCSKSLMDSKDYHKRHKVCEMHSKAPKVVVLGSEQRFCQQCSRFHAISEFDDSKRSCRRRLAGHNERRRKSNSSDSTISRNPIPTLGAMAAHLYNLEEIISYGNIRALGRCQNQEFTNAQCAEIMHRFDEYNGMPLKALDDAEDKVHSVYLMGLISKKRRDNLDILHQTFQQATIIAAYRRTEDISEDPDTCERERKHTRMVREARNILDGLTFEFLNPCPGFDVLPL